MNPPANSSLNKHVDRPGAFRVGVQTSGAGIPPSAPVLHSTVRLRPAEFRNETLNTETQWGVEAWRWNIRVENYRRWAV